MGFDLEERQNFIKKNWFSNHVATVTKHGSVTILDWKNPKHVDGIRYVFLENDLFVTGGYNQAVYHFHEPPTVERLEKMDAGMFLVFLRCGYSVRWDLEPEIAEKQLENWYDVTSKETREEEKEALYQLHQNIKQLIWNSEDVSRYETGIQQLLQDTPFIKEYSSLVHLGKQIPLAYVSHLLGIQMAIEQLRSNGSPLIL